MDGSGVLSKSFTTMIRQLDSILGEECLAVSMHITKSIMHCNNQLQTTSIFFPFLLQSVNSTRKSCLFQAPAAPAVHRSL